MKLFKNYRKELEETQMELVIAQRNFLDIKKKYDELIETNKLLANKIEILVFDSEKLKKQIKSLKESQKKDKKEEKTKKTSKVKKESK